MSYARFFADRLRHGTVQPPTVTQRRRMPVLRAPAGPPPAPIEQPLSLCARVSVARAAELLAAVDLAPPPTGGSKPTFEAMKLEAPTGCCIVCEQPLGTQKKVLCGSTDCAQVYREVWYGDRDAGLRAARAASGLPVKLRRRKYEVAP